MLWKRPKKELLKKVHSSNFALDQVNEARCGKRYRNQEPWVRILAAVRQRA